MNVTRISIFSNVVLFFVIYRVLLLKNYQQKNTTFWVVFASKKS